MTTPAKENTATHTATYTATKCRNHDAHQNHIDSSRLCSVGGVVATCVVLLEVNSGVWLLLARGVMLDVLLCVELELLATVVMLVAGLAAVGGAVALIRLCRRLSRLAQAYMHSVLHVRIKTKEADAVSLSWDPPA